MAITTTPFHANDSPLLLPNKKISPGQYLSSENGRFQLILQADGNLVIKENEIIVWVADSNQAHSKTVASQENARISTLRNQQ